MDINKLGRKISCSRLLRSAFIFTDLIHIQNITGIRWFQTISSYDVSQFVLAIPLSNIIL